MVKTILSLVITFALLVSAALFENFFVNAQFEKFSAAVNSLQEKVRNQTANRADAEAVKTLWDAQKKLLHIVIPHGDIAYIDYWLGEATGCIETEDFRDAVSKIEVLVTICKQLPEQYSVSIENIF